MDLRINTFFKFLKRNPIQQRYFAGSYAWAKKRKILIFVLFVIFGITWVLQNAFSYYYRKNYLDLAHIKQFTKYFINLNLKRAVDIGIVDFNFIDGVILEDMLISKDEDFSNNKLLFSGKKISLKFSSFFGKNPYLKKISIQAATLELDLDDPLTSEILQYFRNFNLSEIEIQNLNLVIRKSGKIFFNTISPIHLRLNKERDKVRIHFNDSPFRIPYFAGVRGEGEVDISQSSIGLHIGIKNFSIRNLSVISELLLNVTPEKGSIDSEIDIKAGPGLSFSGNLDVNDLSGIFAFQSGIPVSGISLKGDFSYEEKDPAPGKKEISFRRKLYSELLYFQNENFIGQNKLSKQKFSLSVNDSEKLFRSISLSENISVKGKLFLDLSLEETGKDSEWFKVVLNSSIPEMQIHTSDNAKIRLDITKSSLTLKENGEFLFDLNGHLFDKKFNSRMDGIVSFSKIRNRYGVLYYPVNSNLKWNAEFREPVILDFFPLYDSAKQMVLSDIRERQEKMFSESFIVQEPLYKIFLENMKLVTRIDLKSVRNRADFINLGDWTIQGDITKGFANLNLTGGIYEKYPSSVTLRGNMNTKSPYFDFRMKTDTLLWADETVNLCGVKLLSDIVDVDFAFTAGGNNFEAVFLSRRITGKVSLRGNTLFRSRQSDSKITAMPLIGDKNSFSFSYEFENYVGEGYKRDVVLKSETYSLNGYAQVKYPEENYSLYGIKDKVPVVFNFVDNGDLCQKK
ncbi:MAG: hypothetical protein K8R21_03210 [Leptospira sp.]|nr:hypothetical protein [Leptospira sp.]